MNVFCGLEFLPYTPSTISLLSATIVLVPISWYTNVCMNISVVLGPKLGPATEDAIGDITSSARTLSTLENSVAIKASSTCHSPYHSCRNDRIPLESTGIHRNETGFHRNATGIHWNRHELPYLGS